MELLVFKSEKTIKDIIVEWEYKPQQKIYYIDTILVPPNTIVKKKY